jgi:hypothetical protein
MRNQLGSDRFLTSPRSRGEVAALSARRVRGKAVRLTHLLHARDGRPSPQPSPRKSGARERAVRAAMSVGKA